MRAAVNDLQHRLLLLDPQADVYKLALERLMTAAGADRVCAFLNRKNGESPGGYALHAEAVVSPEWNARMAAGIHGSSAWRAKPAAVDEVAAEAIVEHLAVASAQSGVETRASLEPDRRVALAHHLVGRLATTVKGDDIRSNASPPSPHPSARLLTPKRLRGPQLHAARYALVLRDAMPSRRQNVGT
jgi:hypothetical protein